MGGAVFGVGLFLPASEAVGPMFVALLVKVGVAIPVYFGAARVLRAPEFGWFFHRKLPKDPPRDSSTAS
jgi:hypothetical protein